MSKTAGADGRFYSATDYQDEDNRRATASMIERPQSTSNEQTNKISLKKYVEDEREREVGARQDRAEPQVQTTTSKKTKQNRAASANDRSRKPAVNQELMEQARKSREEKLAGLTLRKEKSAERLKVEEYVNSLIPYTRDLPNSRLKTFYGKAPM